MKLFRLTFANGTSWLGWVGLQILDPWPCLLHNITLQTFFNFRIALTQAIAYLVENTEVCASNELSSRQLNEISAAVRNS
jgi:hypothetical protein